MQTNAAKRALRVIHRRSRCEWSANEHLSSGELSPARAMRKWNESAIHHSATISINL